MSGVSRPTSPPDAALTLEQTGVEGNLIVGILTSPDGTWQIKASPSAWADLQRDVAAGRNPVVLKPADPDNEQEID